MIRRSLPHVSDELRPAIHGGDVFVLPPSPAARALVDAVWRDVRAELGDSPRRAHEQMDPDAWFAAIGRIRRRLYTDAGYHARVRALLDAAGLDPSHTAFDPLRLRVVRPGGHLDPRARAVYYPHRDTWYGHSSSIITCWLALHDAPAAETFAIYPDLLAKPVPNSSELFDYDAWVADGWDLKIGWQSRDHGLTARYPGVTGEIPPAAPLELDVQKGELVLFSGAHFHATRPHTAARTRLSLDFRAVDLRDHALGAGAPSVDDRSRGDALRDYVHPVPSRRGGESREAPGTWHDDPSPRYVADARSDGPTHPVDPNAAGTSDT